MAVREPDIDLDVHPWERQTVRSCGASEPGKLHAIFLEYAKTKPRSLRVALARSRGLSGKATAAVRASGHLQRAALSWRWRDRADAWDAHVARIDKAAFDAAKIRARKRRLAQLDKISDALGLRLEDLAAKANLEALLKLHAAEQAEYAIPPEDEHDAIGLPRLEDVIRPPEPDEPKGDEP